MSNVEASNNPQCVAVEEDAISWPYSGGSFVPYMALRERGSNWLSSHLDAAVGASSRAS